MKKFILSAFLLTALLGNISIFAQDKVGLQKNDYITNGDANVFQGIPNIGFPLFNVAVPTTGIGINLSLSYTSESGSSLHMTSDVGKGWNLSNIGSIVRNKTRVDDDFHISTTHTNEALSDVYYYSYPGGNGKFYIGMDKTSQELTGVHTIPSNDKIIVTKDPVKPKRVQSFTIVDTKGNRYLFDKINIDKIYLGDGSDLSVGGKALKTKFINSGFFLSKIFNVKNEEVVNIEYLTTTQATTWPAGTLQNQKIKKIMVHGVGSIEYLYADTGTPINLNSSKDQDWYRLNKVVLKDTRNQIVNQYAFTRGVYLRELINQDKNNNPVQKFSFEYNNESSISGPDMLTDMYGYPSYYLACDLDGGELRTPYEINRNTVSYGALKRIILPTGGITEYEFESHSTAGDPINCSGPNCPFDNYDFDKIYTLNFDTKIADQYTINLPAGYQKKFFVKYNYTLHPAAPGHPGIDYEIKYKINDETGEQLVNPLNGQDCSPNLKRFDYFYSATSLDVKFSGIKKGYGTVEIYAPKQQPKDKNRYGYGLRIKSMKNFNPGSATPTSYTRYEYDTFTDPLLSSGGSLDLSEKVLYIDESPKPSSPVGYFNIKVTNMIDGSYSKYYFAAPNELLTLPSAFPSLDDKDMRNYLLTTGLLQKREDYSGTNQLLQKSETQYEYKEVPLSNINFWGNTVKKMNISKQSSSTETYIAGTSKKLVSSSESLFDDRYNYITASKEILSDGTLIEKTLLYPQDKGVQKLLTANMVDIPLETTIKKNGKLIGKAETKFEDPSHVYPTSVTSYNMQTQAPVTSATLDIYDSKGNLVQTTAKNGIPTTTIWGYYQSKPIAVIQGISYAQIASLSALTAAVAASDADFDNPANEPALLQALENLRKDPALKGYAVTATTYDPMIGVTNSISANGIKTMNVYDSANRLIKVTDAAGKTLQEYQYNYKH
ncbi:hypothetical protein [Chryseobacterium sp. OSA05B]|uniref:hypothetical protein n=1 Tax=Chryseobacterium sp. OSA05B TaxID=2862650 RepID=UPI001CBC4CB4|nr:hypothetical protein [Chryseobacterium sp. OSA05B]